ncbi:MAG: UvrD-helicase domain-containing protein, partial [Chlamydiia bacterium]|nr:UvrD-helicase domain-containing protein [Chlamydiia bacterium]
MHSQLASLNPEQLRAVQTTRGRVLILAGAGTGKTMVLTTRIAYLLSQGTAEPKHILGLTFTNKAALEMRQRISRMVSPEAAKELTLATFHSFCMNILRKEIHHLGWTNQFTLYQPGDVERLLQALARDMLNVDGELPSLSSAINLINRAKNGGLEPEEMQAGGTTWHDDFVRTLYRKFLDAMRAHNALDFDLLLVLTVRLFEKHPEILSEYQDRYRFLMIDEYQDTNPIQFRLAELLTQKHKNLCVVGDDDQSIYGWRGADVKNILEFGDAAVIKLEQNYRSTPTILNAANAVIGLNTTRHQKALWSRKEPGAKITVFNTPTDLDEAQAVIY